MTCSYCSADVPEGDRFCESCGTQLETKAVPEGERCTCGALLADCDEDGYCVLCGTRIARASGDHVEIAEGDFIGGVSDRGRVHRRNEDRVAVHAESGRSMLVVCDGVSASDDPERASQQAVDTISLLLRTALGREEPEEPEALLQAAFTQAAKDLSTSSHALSEGDAPSTTAVAAWIAGEGAAVAWVGDSRAYWIDEDTCMQLTRDHSWAEEAVARGAMSRTEAESAPMAHAITRWLGADAGGRAEPEIVHFKPKKEGLFLLCSDGLWNYSPDPDSLGRQVRTVREGTADALALCRELVMWANEQGGRDNITVAVCRWQPPASVAEWIEPLNHESSFCVEEGEPER